MVKEATIECMEEMRFLARARNIDEMWGVATNLYDWQFVNYNKADEIFGKKDFYSVSALYPCYMKNSSQYTYSDNDMKMTIAMLRCLLKEIHRR